jgi:signal transduction histidine kinase
MPQRLPRELRVLYQVARGAASQSSPEDAVRRLCEELEVQFDFDNVRFAGEDAAREDHVLLDAALEARRAVACRDRVAVPLLVNGSCLGYLVADRGGEPLELGRPELDLLSALGLVGGVIVEKAQQQEELESALEELRRVDELKDEFVSIASHELRAPIAVVYGITSTLHRHGSDLTPGQMRELRESLYEQTVRLHDLTEQLLDLSRLDSGRIRVDERLFRPRDAVDSLVTRIAPDRRADVRVEIEPDEVLVSDPVAFDRVVGNLLANALKYGRPPVVVSLDETGIVVEDLGPGIPPEFVPHLFDRFTRAEHVPSTVAGAGLGLAIAREFAEAVGGRLEYEAGATGARFVFELPRSTLSAARP